MEIKHRYALRNRITRVIAFRCDQDVSQFFNQTCFLLSGVKASPGHSASIIGMMSFLPQVFRCGDNRPLRVHLEVAALPLFEEYQTHAQMITIRIWVYDGILASGVAGPIDVLNAASHLDARKFAAPGATSKALPMCSRGAWNR